MHAKQKKKKKGSAQGSLEIREVSNSSWEGTRREKTRLKKVIYLVRTKYVLLHVAVYGDVRI